MQTKTFNAPKPGDTIQCNENKYLIGNPIGGGGFGYVYDCSDDWYNSLVAKIITPQNKSYDQIHNEWTKETLKLLQLRHPNITYVHNAFEYRNTFYIIIEKCTTLNELLINPAFIDVQPWFPFFARDILYGLQYIHNHGYVHKDLHAGNIFVTLNEDKNHPDIALIDRFKIGDLGISNLEATINPYNTILAEWMLPPEILDPSEFGVIDRRTDIYHCALLFLSILTHQSFNFSKQEILSAKPRILAEGLNSPYSVPLSNALRRHVSFRTSTALIFWRQMYDAALKVQSVPFKASN